MRSKRKKICEKQEELMYLFVPLHHRTMLTISGECPPPILTPPPQKGGARTPPSKLRQKTARRYNKRKSLRAVLHGRDVSDYPPSNRGSHRRRWRAKTCARPGQVRRVGRGEGGGGGSGGKHHGTSTTGLSCRRRLM